MLNVRSFFIFLLLSFVALQAGVVYAEDATQARVHKIKAGFLFNFAKFATWPPEVTPSNSLLMCMWGESEFKKYFQAFSKRVIKKKKVEVRYVATTKEVNGCHVLFVEHTLGESKIRRIYQELREHPTLLVTDIVSGGVINIIPGGKLLRFEIYPDRASRARIKLSSQLLKLAQIVDGE